MCNSQISDSEILAGIRSGYTSSFEELLRNYEQSVYSLCSLLTRNVAEFERAMCRLTRKIIAEAPKLPEDTALKLWMLKSAVESVKGDDDTEIYELDSVLDLPDSSISVDAEESSSDKLQRAIRFLPTDYRVVFILRDVLRLSFEEIAFLSGLSDESVRANLHRSRFMLRRLMHQELKVVGEKVVVEEEVFPIGETLDMQTDHTQEKALLM